MKKTIYNIKNNKTKRKITDHGHNYYITTQEFSKLTSEEFASRLAQASFASKNDIAVLIKTTDFDDKLKTLSKKVTSNKARHIEVNTKLDDLEKKVKTISTKGLKEDLINKFSILNGAKYNGLQNYLVFISTRYIKTINNSTSNIESWISTGMSQESIKNPHASGANSAPKIIHNYRFSSVVIFSS